VNSHRDAIASSKSFREHMGRILQELAGSRGSVIPDIILLIDAFCSTYVETARIADVACDFISKHSGEIAKTVPGATHDIFEFELALASCLERFGLHVEQVKDLVKRLSA